MSCRYPAPNANALTHFSPEQLLDSTREMISRFDHYANMACDVAESDADSYRVRVGNVAVYAVASFDHAAHGPRDLIRETFSANYKQRLDMPDPEQGPAYDPEHGDLEIVHDFGAPYDIDKVCAETETMIKIDDLPNSERIHILTHFIGSEISPDTIKSITGQTTATLPPCSHCYEHQVKSTNTARSTLYVSVGYAPNLTANIFQIRTLRDIRHIHQATETSRRYIDGAQIGILEPELGKKALRQFDEDINRVDLAGDKPARAIARVALDSILGVSRKVTLAELLTS